MDSRGVGSGEMASWERERHSDRYGMGSRGDEAKSKGTTEVDDMWLTQTVEKDREKWKDSVRLEAWHRELLDDGKGKKTKGLSSSDKRGMQRKRIRRGQSGATEVNREEVKSTAREPEHIVPAPPYGHALGSSVGCHDKFGIAEASERGTDNVLPGGRLSQDNVH